VDAAPTGLVFDIFRAAYGASPLPHVSRNSAAWRSLLQHSAEHQVLAFVADWILRSERKDAQLVLAPILQHYRDLTAQDNDRKRRVLAHCTRILANANLQCVALKGAAFLTELRSPCAQVRSMADLDVLVRPSELVTSFTVLKQAGFYELANHEAVHLHHAPPLADPEGLTFIELHDRLAAGRRNPIPTEVLFRHAVWSEANGVQIRVPSPEHRVVHLIAHAMLSHKGARLLRLTLRDLIDLLEICKLYTTDWSEVRRCFEGIGRRKQAAGFLLVAERLLAPAFHAPAWAREGRTWAERAIDAYFRPQRYRARRLWGQFLCDMEALMEHPEYRRHAIRTFLRPSRLWASAQRYRSLR
jgi:Uncharacterised nucleotidyltransferase